jgi:hypothetical protein
MDAVTGAGVGIGMVMWLILLVIGILWICMPFAIFGTKPLLRELLAEQRRTNQLLVEVAERAKPGQGSLVSEKYRDT